MFTELMPLLKQRVVMITISDIGEGLLRVNVIPRKLEGSGDENSALTAPLSITGKADELDRELPGQLTSFTESVTKTGSNLDELKTQHAAAIKAIEAENKKRMEDKKKGNGSRTASTPPPASAPTGEFKDGKPMFGRKASQGPVENGSLFDNPPSTKDTEETSVPRGGRRPTHLRAVMAIETQQGGIEMHNGRSAEARNRVVQRNSENHSDKVSRARICRNYIDLWRKSYKSSPDRRGSAVMQPRGDDVCIDGF